MMANEQNLIVPTSELAREYGRRGGKKKAENARKRKAMKEQMELLLSLPVKSTKMKGQLKKIGIKADEIDNQMALIVSIYQTALKGGKNSVQAFNVIRDMMEEEKEKNEVEDLTPLAKLLGVDNND